MARVTMFFALLTLCLAPFPTVDAADDGAPELTVLKAKIRFGKLGRGDSLKVTGVFDPHDVPQGFTPHNGRVAVSIGPVSVMSLPPIDSRASLRTTKSGNLVYTRKRTREEADFLRLRIDTAKGKFVLKGRRLDLDTLKSAGSAEVAFTLILDGTALTTTITLGDRDGRWTYRHSPHSTVPGFNGWPGGGGAGGGGGGGGGQAAFRILYSGVWLGRSTFTTTVVRNVSDYHAEWSQRIPTPGPGAGAPTPQTPAVNFATEMVVIIDLGRRNTGGYSVDVVKATPSGTGLRVDWVEYTPGNNCAVVTALTAPFVIAAVTRRDGAVTFPGTSEKRDCP